MSDTTTEREPGQSAVDSTTLFAEMWQDSATAPRLDGLGASAGSAWMHQPTCSGWWWWEKSETPIFIEPITNGRREKLGLGADLPTLGIKRCVDMAGRWAGPIVRPPLPNASVNHRDKNRLLDKTDTIAAGDQVLGDDCQTWWEIPAIGQGCLWIGKRYEPEFFQPMRRIDSANADVSHRAEPTTETEL